jgi:rod shape-determining protein MreD
MTLGGGVHTHIVRAALLVALAALLEVALSPLLTFGWVAPRFLVVGVVIAVTGLRDLQALLLGFFGGVLTDALSGGLFGAGALGGVLAAAISLRLGAARRKVGSSPALAQAVAVAVVVYDFLGLFAPILAGQDGPPITTYIAGGVVPDALLNALLAYLVGGRLLKLITTKEEKWT